MKKILLFLFLIFSLPIFSYAYSFEVDGVYYTFLSDKEVEVTYNELSSLVTYYSSTNIPSKVSFNGKTYNVIRIGDRACCNATGNISIPEGIKSVGEKAFQNSSITSVTLPSTLEKIEGEAFYSCDKLKEITIPNSVTTMAGDAFYTSLGAERILNFPSLEWWYNLDITSIFDGWFKNSKVLFNGEELPAELVIPSTITAIKDNHFCEAPITKLVIEEGVKEIGTSVFRCCTELTDVSLPYGLERIGNSAFQGCSSLPSIIIPRTVNTMEKYAFQGCSSIEITDMAAVPQQIIYNDIPPYSTVHVRKECLEAYQSADYWKSYLTLVADLPDCETPVVDIQEGEISFSCETPNSVCEYSITGNSPKVDLSEGLTMNVYARAKGYNDSLLCTPKLEY